jgi:hypothetical protein
LKNLTPEGGKVLKKSSGRGPYVLRTDTRHGRAQVVQVLYMEGASVDPALCDAVADGQEDMVDVLLNARRHPRSVRCAGQSLLELARRLEPPHRDRILALFKKYEPPVRPGGRP